MSGGRNKSKTSLGSSRICGKTRNERQESARDREQNWIRNADFPGDERKQRDGHETNQN